MGKQKRAILAVVNAALKLDLFFYVDKVGLAHLLLFV